MIDSGRKRKYDKERLSERIVFYVTESQRKELESTSGGDISTYTRERVFGNNTPKLHAVPATKKSDIKTAVLEALAEHNSTDHDTHQISLSPQLNEKLEAVSESIGFSEPAQLIEEVLRVLLREPAQLREMVLGRTLLDIEAALGIAPDLTDKPKKFKKTA